MRMMEFQVVSLASSIHLRSSASSAVDSSSIRPPFPIGFVRGNGPGGPHWLRLGNGPLARSNDAFRNSTHHNGSMGSFGKPIRGRSGPFSRPILPRQPLASFRNTVVGFVRGNDACGSFGETAASRRSVRIVKERRTRGLQLHHRRTPRARPGNPLKKVGVVAVDTGARFSTEQPLRRSDARLGSGHSSSAIGLSSRSMRNRIWPSSSPRYSLWGQGQLTGSSWNRGMMCQWP